MSGTHGVFQHRTGYFFTILEEDFCEIFKAPSVNEVCRAYITSILEHLTNKQYEAIGSDKDLWVFMSLPEMARRMRHACSERTIHKELSGMIKDGYLEKRRAVGKATMEYKLNLKRIRKALEALPDVQSCNSATYHLANLQEPSSNSARLILQNSKVDLANLQPRVPIDIPIEETKNTESTFINSASAEVDAPAPIDFQERKRKTDPSLPAISSHTEEEIDITDAPTVKVPVTKPQQTAAPPSKDEGEQPPMALTARQIKVQFERREKELWLIIEQERNTKYTETQRRLYENKEGMKCLIADDISDEVLCDGLQKLDDFQRKSFTVLKFYGWMPNLSAKEPIPITNGKVPTQNNGVNHDLNQRKLEERKARFAAHG